jgi:hypothetical protein
MAFEPQNDLERVLVRPATCGELERPSHSETVCRAPRPIEDEDEEEGRVPSVLLVP